MFARPRVSHIELEIILIDAEFVVHVSEQIVDLVRVDVVLGEAKERQTRPVLVLDGSVGGLACHLVDDVDVRVVFVDDEQLVLGDESPWLAVDLIQIVEAETFVEERCVVGHTGRADLDREYLIARDLHARRLESEHVVESIVDNEPEAVLTRARASVFVGDEASIDVGHRELVHGHVIDATLVIRVGVVIVVEFENKIELLIRARVDRDHLIVDFRLTAAVRRRVEFAASIRGDKLAIDRTILRRMCYNHLRLSYNN